MSYNVMNIKLFSLMMMILHLECISIIMYPYPISCSLTSEISLPLTRPPKILIDQMRLVLLLRTLREV